MGLRADKQRAQRIAILENAFAYMCEHEGALPTMAELARRCEISEATVFNYVGQRDAIAAEWAHRNLSDLCADLAEEGGSLRRALRLVQRALAAQAAERPEVWLHVWGRATSADPSLGRPGGAAGPDCAGAPCPGLARLVTQARDRGEIRGDIELATQTGALAGVWLAALAHESQRARSTNATGLDDRAWQRVAGAVELVLDGLRKRNERVRVAPASAPSAVRGGACVGSQGPS